MKKQLLVSVLGVGMLGLALAIPAQANVLTFDGNICNGGSSCGNGSFIDQSYGDVPGQVDVVYRNVAGGGNPPPPGLRFWTTDYNDLVNVAWTDGGDGAAIAEIFLSPEPGMQVTLNSFDLGAWPDTQRGSQYTIFDGAFNSLLSSGPLTIGIFPGNLHNHFTPNLTSNNGIRIQWGPSAYNVGIDNVNFTVSPIQHSTVPEPATGLLLAGGLGVLAVRRRMSR